MEYLVLNGPGELNRHMARAEGATDDCGQWMLGTADKRQKLIFILCQAGIGEASVEPGCILAQEN